MIILEWKDISEHSTVAKKLESRGYRLADRFIEDLVMVRKGSAYDPGVSYKFKPGRYANKTVREQIYKNMRNTFESIDFAKRG